MTPQEISTRILTAGDRYLGHEAEEIGRRLRFVFNAGYRAALKDFGLTKDGEASESPQQAAAQGVDDAS